MTVLCPRCTLGRTGQPWPGADVGANYRARVCEGFEVVGLLEDDDGNIRRPTPAQWSAINEARLADLGQAVRAARAGRDARVLQVGARQGAFLRGAAHMHGIKGVGLEPWRPWLEQARDTGVGVHGKTLEHWDGEGEFDVVVEHGLLQHLHDPLRHLRAMAARLSSRGVALIEVPNLLGSAGLLSSHFLRADSPLVFTPRSLATLCQRAGLHAFFILNEPRLRLFCRKGPAARDVLPGPNALAVAQAAWGNDLRLSIKRALAKRGPTPQVLGVAGRVHRQCAHAPARADIAIEIANGCERCSDYDHAAHWLEASLADRPDPEVEATLERVEEVRAAIRRGEPARPDDQRLVA